MLFVLTGIPWIARPGIQTDEALFSAGIYAPFADDATRVRVFGHDYSIMVMTYVGTLKARIWSPIFRTFGVTAGSIRIPAVIIGAISIWWFFRLLRRTLGDRAAVIGTGLLATDTLYLLTVRWDWGPVALQHALLIGGMLGVVAWWQDRKLRWLALGFFAFGLALWDKALFAWSLVALGIATTAIFHQQLRDALRVKNLAVAALAFLLGAAPLIVYNLRTDWMTFRSNTQRTKEDLRYKIKLLGDTVDGSAMRGFLTRLESDGPVRTPDRPLEKFVVAASEWTGKQGRTLQLLALYGCLALLPLVRNRGARRAAYFALIFSGLLWVQMASMQNGGTGVHHTILLWPMPALIIAAVGGALADRTARPWRFVAVLTGTLMLSGLLVTASYYRDLLRNGGTVTWSDAFYGAMKEIRQRDPSEVYIVEWGFFDNMRAFGRGRIRIGVANDPGVSEADRDWALQQISDPRAVFVTHVKGVETEPGRGDRIVAHAAANGYQKANAKVFHDSNGRPIVEVFSFARAEETAQARTLP